MGEDPTAGCVHSFIALATLKHPCNPRDGYCMWRDRKPSSCPKPWAHLISAAPSSRGAQCPQLYCPSPSSKMQFILQHTVLQCSRAAVVLVQNCSHLPCWDIFGDSMIFEKKKPSPEWELEKSFVPWQRLIPNGQAVPEAGGSKRAGEAGVEWCQSSFPRDSQAETDFWGPFLYCKRKQESWQHGLRRYHWFSAYFNKWVDCSRVLAEFAELEKSGESWGKGTFF